jgi:hypothetical protein
MTAYSCRPSSACLHSQAARGHSRTGLGRPIAAPISQPKADDPPPCGMPLIPACRLDANGAGWLITVHRVRAIHIVVAEGGVIKDAIRRDHVALGGVAGGKTIGAIFPYGQLVINVVGIALRFSGHLLVDQGLNAGNDRRRKRSAAVAGSESEVRYSVRPTMESALFCYWREAA